MDFISASTYFCLAVLAVVCEVNGHLRIPLKRITNPPYEDDLQDFHLRTVLRLQEKFAKGSSGSVSLNNAEDVEYFGEISLGTPTQTFNALFDTGSADLWVPSLDCGFWQIGCWFHKKYNHKKSSSYKRDGREFAIKYVAGSAVGYLSRDSLTIGDISVTNQTFAEIIKPNWEFYFTKFDGILGLGFKNASVSHENPPFTNMIQQGVVKKPIFCFYLSKDKEAEEGGELILGATNKKTFQGKIYLCTSYQTRISVGFQTSRNLY